jgi:hypothetical protein
MPDTTTPDSREFFDAAIAEGRATAAKWRQLADELDASLDEIEQGVGEATQGR